MSPEDYEILVHSLAPKRDGTLTKPPDYAVRLLEDTCARTGLDWKQRHVYLMNRGGKWAVTLSIDGFRLIGAQDPDYVGQDGPFWVPAPDATWTDIPPPGPIYAAKVGIKHRNGTVTWGVARFKDYATGAMWDKFPSTMSAKCAEMLAWRKAFPGRLGGLYGVEEMEQAGFKAKAAPEDAPPPAPVVSEEDVDSVKNKYLIALNGAKSREELRGIGQQITKDQALTHAAVMELHLVYTDKVKAYAAR